MSSAEIGLQTLQGQTNPAIAETLLFIDIVAEVAEVADFKERGIGPSYSRGGSGQTLQGLPYSATTLISWAQVGLADLLLAARSASLTVSFILFYVTRSRPRASHTAPAIAPESFPRFFLS